ncbi:hypothetical protein [Aureitalea marina]|uniref:Uncharacterized protein n=1 Tax=Aureitalea marina TaxID=930804 RepID=A0A2S7KLV2_9FLAO|nr:hypothetical protein [Aureitalea marina]PQB03571.1 hypothetical protein BST85_00655 [Aureitalea marina]
MKTAHILFLFTLTFLIISCSKDSEFIEAEQDQNFQLEIPASELSNSIDENSSNRFGLQAPPLESYMQVTAYITAKTLMYDGDQSAAQNQFTTALGSGNVVNVSDLIGKSADGTAFKTSFVQHLTSYFDGTGPCESCPGGEEEEPPLTGNGRFAQLTEVLVANFIDYVTEDNCVELFVPNPLNYSLGQITSVAHPMTTSTWNKGYERYDIAIEGLISKQVNVVNQLYVNHNNNMIIARPFTTTSPASCAYTDYSHIDFTQFLNN